MDWRSPYTISVLVAGVLVVIGAFIVITRSPVPPQQTSITWSGGVPASDYQGVPASPASPQQVVQAVISPAGATLELPTLASATTSTASQQQGSFDYLALLAQLSGGATVSGRSGASASTTIANAYEYIPSGLIATTAPTTRHMTAEQKALYDYGNEVGGEIQGFENLHTNAAQVLKDQATDRTNTAKADTVVSLAKGYASVGSYMQQMQDVPTSVASYHSALAQSYVDIGAKLQLVTSAQGDAAFVQAIESYDSTANTFVKNYASLAQYLEAQGVVFSPQDPGSIFTFTETNGVGGL